MNDAAIYQHSFSLLTHNHKLFFYIFIYIIIYQLVVFF
jgi:hypothetical protein